VKGFKRGALFFNIVGMNSLFIYLFTNTGGSEWFNRMARPFTMGVFRWAGDLNAKIITSLIVWGMLWSLCYWLYKKRIFIKI
jgi:hypothetical protein